MTDALPSSFFATASIQYEHLYKITPKIGAIVNTNEGRGTVVDSNVLTGMLKIRLDRRPDAAPATYMREDVKLVRDGRVDLDKKELDALKGIE